MNASASQSIVRSIREYFEANSDAVQPFLTINDTGKLFYHLDPIAGVSPSAEIPGPAAAMSVAWNSSFVVVS